MKKIKSLCLNNITVTMNKVSETEFIVTLMGKNVSQKVSYKVADLIYDDLVKEILK